MFMNNMFVDHIYRGIMQQENQEKQRQARKGASTMPTRQLAMLRWLEETKQARSKEMKDGEENQDSRQRVDSLQCSYADNEDHLRKLSKEPGGKPVDEDKRNMWTDAQLMRTFGENFDALVYFFFSISNMIIDVIDFVMANYILECN